MLSRAAIKEHVRHWIAERNTSVVQGDKEWTRFADAKIAYWNAKLKKKRIN